jgi:3-hydroxyisobutyrate dehydrogenase-like beta-hydroxyacid dehydrogenase
MIGLGLLGSVMAERFLVAGYRVVGFDVDSKRRTALAQLGGAPVESGRAVAASCSQIVLSLPNSAIARRVIDEIEPALSRGTIVVDTTTGDPGEMAEMGEKLAAMGVAYLDATVGGGSQQVRERGVTVMVGGDAATFSACKPLFDCIAKEVFHVGPCGAGATMKLIVNLVLGLNRAALAEGLAFARSLGVDLAQALEVLRAGPAWSKAMDVKGAKMITGDFEPQARLSQHLKDVRLILAAGKASGARLPMSELHRQLLESVERQGFGDADNSAIIKAFE